jgi:hypothetical protein
MEEKLCIYLGHSPSYDIVNGYFVGSSIVNFGNGLPVIVTDSTQKDLEEEGIEDDPKLYITVRRFSG